MEKGKNYGAEKKLCFMEDFSQDKTTFQTYKRLVKDPQFICRGCGRVAKNDHSLCSPEKM